jgi:hypothetical protein
MRGQGDMMTVKSSGWYKLGGTTQELKIEALMLLMFENINSSSALFMIELLHWWRTRKQVFCSFKVMSLHDTL